MAVKHRKMNIFPLDSWGFMSSLVRSLVSMFAVLFLEENFLPELLLGCCYFFYYMVCNIERVCQFFLLKNSQSIIPPSLVLPPFVVPLLPPTSSFHSAVRSRMDAVINALDNLAARLYVDRGLSFFLAAGGGTGQPPRIEKMVSVTNSKAPL